MTAVTKDITTETTNQFPIAQLDMENHADYRHLSKVPLLNRLTDIVANHSNDPPLRRHKLMACYKGYFATSLGDIQNTFESGKAQGAITVSAIAYVVDVLLQSIFEIESTIHQDGRAGHNAITVMATGGYGRGELAPKSDVDILFLTTDKPDASAEKVINDFMYILWDLRIKVGHSVRSISDAMHDANQDMVFRTSMIDARFVTGDKGLFDNLMGQFNSNMQKWSVQGFLDAKMQEWDDRHKKSGDTRYRLEPNIKNGKGGLRDLHTLYWLARYILKVRHVEELAPLGIFTADEITRFANAQEFLWQVRCHLHYATQSATETLSFDAQVMLAERLYPPHNDTKGQGAKEFEAKSAEVSYNLGPNHAIEQLMRDYFLTVRDVGLLMGIFISAVRSQVAMTSKRRWLRLPKRAKSCQGYTLQDNQLTLTQSMIDVTSLHMVRIFQVALDNGLEIHPKTLQLLNRNLHRLKPLGKELAKDQSGTQDSSYQGADILNTFLTLLCCQTYNPAGMLGRMNECGVLGALLPDFTGIVAQMQYNMYHHYTTDEHTIRAIGTLWKLEQQQMVDVFPVVSQIIGDITNRRVLYVAVLLHDIAKGRGGDHCVLGAAVARNLCPQLGLTADETEQIAWLIENHLYMSDMAFRRDLGDVKTIDNFVKRMHSRDAMQLLYCLTAVDIYSVGDGVWTSWKAGLLHTLYYISEGAMTGNISNRQKLLDMANQKSADIRNTSTHPPKMVEDFLQALPNSYLVTTPASELLLQIDIVAQDKTDSEKIQMAWQTDEERGVTTLRVYTLDHLGLFNRITGAVSSCKVSIMGARCINLNNAMCMTILHLQDYDNNPIDHISRGHRIEEKIIKALSGEIRLSKAVANASKRYNPKAENFYVKPRVTFIDKASDELTVIECRGLDRVGLLFDISNVFLDSYVHMVDAHVVTYGERVVDIFYLRGMTGGKITDEKHRQKLQERLLKVL